MSGSSKSLSALMQIKLFMAFTSVLLRALHAYLQLDPGAFGCEGASKAVFGRP
jgi:hypothetical protein